MKKVYLKREVDEDDQTLTDDQPRTGGGSTGRKPPVDEE